MATNRIQKLLFSEYSDFEDIVLVESPFAETSRGGKGIRQVQMALTPTKLILATYHMEAQDEYSPCQVGDNPSGQRRQDPDIECFELISAYPVECVNLSVFRHRRRQTIKARFCNGSVVYYELGGWQERKMMWSVWCERIKFLSPYEARTSVSETSVATSSSGTGSSLYIVRSSLSVSQAGQPTLWCHYATSEKSHQAWTGPQLCLSLGSDRTGQKLTYPEEIGKKRGCRIIELEGENKICSEVHLILSVEHEAMALEAVELWESQLSRRAFRLYGLCAFPHLLAGLGLYRLSRPEAFSLQTKKSVSMVHLPQTRSLSTKLPRPQLVRTVSLESLAVPAMCPDKLFQLADSVGTPREVVKFWTTASDDEPRVEWSRPQYEAQRRHLRSLCKHSTKCCDKTRPMFKTNRKRLRSKLTKGSNVSCRLERGSRHSGGGDSSSKQSPWTVTWQRDKHTGWRGSGAWSRNIPSSSLAHQLTMIDKDLFLQVTTLELGRLKKDKCSWRAPRLWSMLSFSRRVSCLVASQVVAGRSVRERAVLIVKFVGVVYKCHKLHSLQSAISVLRGLQSPAVYRLHLSWAYVRKHHASKYRRFEDLSRRYQDPRLPLYQRTYDQLIATPPFLPPAELLSAVMLEQLPGLPRSSVSSMFSTECSTQCSALSPMEPRHKKLLRKFLSVLSLSPGQSLSPQRSLPNVSSCYSETHLQAVSEDVLLDHLDKFFSPVSSTCPQRRLLQDVQYFLESHQAAAARYAIPANPRVRSFLLLGRYHPLARLLALSRQLEP